MATQMKVQKTKRTREEKKKETNPSESHVQHPQPQTCSNHAPAVRGIIEECPGPEGAESSDGKPPETPVQGFLYPAVALSIDPKIPDQASRKDTATPIDQDQKVSKKNKKSNHVAAPSIEPTIQTGQDPPVDPTTPVDPEQMTKKKSKKSNSALKNEGLESEKRNAGLNAETAVQKIERPTAKKSMGRHNAEPAAKSPVRRTEHLKVTESPSKRHGDSSLSCEACQQLGHRLDQCKRLRRLSKKEEVCFFCGKIGHSLGKCGVSQAGGRFAKCLLCHEHGHFGYNCPQSENGKKRKELVANGASSGSEIRSAKCSLCHKRGHRSSNCPQNRHDPKVLAANGAVSRTAVETKGQPLPEFNASRTVFLMSTSQFTPVLPHSWIPVPLP
ncbi:replication protein A 70 kDa DNA-binding subunit C-like [Vigna umbellata]|uniref:replication protein A 70 kDa DNA-binding subunit C-like n=1 Tax=Vigna umbellata TaxID=87088 RepID=UPI001F5EE7D5|nr:replication protein A 70 kDa DNA-binding subunit C-like [Vigna umbellata]